MTNTYSVGSLGVPKTSVMMSTHAFRTATISLPIEPVLSITKPKDALYLLTILKTSAKTSSCNSFIIPISVRR